MRLVLGVDVGSTKCHALVAGDDGQILGFGRAGAGNHQVVGYAGMAAAVRAATAPALELAGLAADQIAFAGVGISGYDWPSQHAQMIDTLRAAGIAAPLEIVNDAVLGLLMAVSAAPAWAWAGCSRAARPRPAPRATRPPADRSAAAAAIG